MLGLKHKYFVIVFWFFSRNFRPTQKAKHHRVHKKWRKLRGVGSLIRLPINSIHLSQNRQELRYLPLHLIFFWMTGRFSLRLQATGSQFMNAWIQMISSLRSNSCEFTQNLTKMKFSMLLHGVMIREDLYWLQAALKPLWESFSVTNRSRLIRILLDTVSDQLKFY